MGFTARKCSSKEAKGNKDWGGKKKKKKHFSSDLAKMAQRGKLKSKVETIQVKMACGEGKKQALLFHDAVRMVKVLFDLYLIFCAMERGTQQVKSIIGQLRNVLGFSNIPKERR